MTLQELAYFVEVARVGSIGQAAANLFVSPQAISKGIKNLETGLGKQVFSRTARGVKLTLFGEHFLKEAMPIMRSLQGLNDFGHEFDKSEPKTIHLIIDTINSFGYKIDRLAKQYHAEHPDINVVVETARIESDAHVVSNRADIIFLCNRPGILNPQMCEISTLFTSKTVAMTHTNNLICKSKLLNWSAFSNVSIFLRSEDVYYAQKVIQRCVDSGFYPMLSYRGDNMLDPFNFANNNEGVAFVPDFVAEFFRTLSDNITVLDFETGVYTEYVFATKRDNKKEFLEDFIINISEMFLKDGVALV